MPKLVIIRGNSGSGKSTLAKNLQQRFGRNTLMISQDMIRREMLWVQDGPGTPAVALLIELLQYGQEHCPVTILEGILYADYYEPVFQAAIQIFGSENVHAYYYDLPFEETLNRHWTKPNYKDFGPPAMREWFSEKDLIGFITETIFTSELSLEEASDVVYHHLAP